MNEYTFDVGHRDVTVSAITESEAREIIQQFGEEDQSIQLIRAKYIVPVGTKLEESESRKLIKEILNGYKDILNGYSEKA